MVTFEKILEIFRDYLREDSCAEVVHTKWGYVRLFCEAPYSDMVEAVLCRTPAELFGELLELYLAEREYRFEKTQDMTAQDMKKELESIREEFEKKLEEAKETKN